MQEFGTRIWAGTLLLQCIWLARGIAFCCRTFGTSSEQILEARLRAQKWWAAICPQMDHRLIEKVDAAKCRMTRLVWILLTACSMFRLTLQQLMNAFLRTLTCNFFLCDCWFGRQPETQPHHST